MAAVDMSLNVGNLIPLGIALVGVVWRLSHLASAQERTAEKVTELQTHRDRHDHRIRGVEQGNIAIVTELRGLTDMVREVRDAVRPRAGS
ncbi:hypothetical protein [Rubellimicrobium aerolatum]|uniref:Chemotaxis protein n=1 Tax=Rubellimicrobium aerolatum TaxID=490979 RepID=A0ABW0SF86_9RHOB|nr:hypothetical protein [Rubellimicrobium aerolatum]MBP1806453.1 hypothetical protein [Rubellimicrobium aerolatum]